MKSCAPTARAAASTSASLDVRPAVGDVVADACRRTGTPPAARSRAGGGTRAGPARAGRARRSARCPRPGRRSGPAASSPSTCPRRSRRRAPPSRPARCAGRCRATPPAVWSVRHRPSAAARRRGRVVATARRPAGHRRVGEADGVEHEFAARPPEVLRVRRLRGERVQPHQLRDPADRDPGLLPGVEHLGQLLDRREEHVDVEHEGDQRTGAQVPVRDQAGADARARSRRRRPTGTARTGSRPRPAVARRRARTR